MNRYGYDIDRFFALQLENNTLQKSSLYHFVIHPREKRLSEIGEKKLTKALQTLGWVDTDNYSRFFLDPYNLSLNAINFTRAAATWTHLILSKENPYYYSEHKIFECYSNYTKIVQKIVGLFKKNLIQALRIVL